MDYLETYDAAPDDATRMALLAGWLRSAWRPLFAELRDQRPILQAPAATLVTLDEDVREVLAAPGTFSVEPYAPAMDVVVQDFMLARDNTLSNHEKQVLHQAVQPELGRVRELAGGLARTTLDRCATQGYVDVVPRLGRGVPAALCTELFGIPAPADDRGALLRWSRATQEDIFRNPRGNLEVHEASMQAGRELRGHLEHVLKDRSSAPPRDDVLGRLVARQGQGGLDDEQRVLANLVGLLVGSIETISQAVVQALEHLLREPSRSSAAVLAARSGDTSDVDGHVWEALRFAPLTPLLRRRCAQAAEIGRGGHRREIAAGTMVWVCTASAMFDERAVSRPERFEPGRRDRLGLHFGMGTHECLGRRLAALVVPEVVRQVLRRPEVRLPRSPYGEVDLRGGPFPERFLVAYGPRELEPRWEPAPGRRSPAKDGLLNRAEFALSTSCGPLWSLAQSLPRAERAVNGFLIDRAASRMASRPNPMSTRTPYTSWASLTDRTYDGRHLPPGLAPGLPEVDLVTELFARPAGGRTELSTKSTMLFAYFAQWFTDGFLRGDRGQDRPPGTNTSTHEIDLCQLYGLDEAMTNQLRSHTDGRLQSRLVAGEELPPLLFTGGRRRECFSTLKVVGEQTLSDRQRAALLAMGSDRANAQVGLLMMNVLFLREHNRVAGLLKRGHPDWDDERLFQTARNVLIVLLIRIVVGDYINHIAPYRFRFQPAASAFARAPWNRPNWMAVEFNLLYRWHSLVPSTLQLAGGRVPAMRTVFAQHALDYRLGPLLAEASAQPSGRIGLFNTDAGLLPAEAASLHLGRQVELQGYNDYREHCGMPRATTFDQVSGDLRVQERLRRLYGSVDRLELYVGLFAEDLRANSALPALMGRMVGVDAFSQAMTNPLLAARVYGEQTFGPEGCDVLSSTRTLADVIVRNATTDGPARFSMTRADWVRSRR